MSDSPSRHAESKSPESTHGSGATVPHDLPADPTDTYEPDLPRGAVSRVILEAFEDDKEGSAPSSGHGPGVHRDPRGSRPSVRPLVGDEVEYPSSVPRPPRVHHAPRGSAGASDSSVPEKLKTAVRGPNDTLPDVGGGSIGGTPETQHGFEMDRIIGRGGVGEVWQAKQLSLGRLIAVKKLRDDFYEQNKENPSEVGLYEDAFRQEALTTGFLEHPNIVPVYDFSHDVSQHPLLAMKLVNGRPWSKTLREDFTKLAPVELIAKHLPVLIDVAQAVAFAHSKGVIHRDIKPAQVMVGEFGEVLLMDWGLAVRYREVDPAQSGEMMTAPSLRYVPSTMTASSPSGTPAYMAPEQTEKSGKRLGTWTDVFLLGGTLYHMLTATPPHQSASSISAFTAARVGKIEPPHLRAPNREIPPELSELCLKAMATNPADRLSSARDFIKGVEDYISGASRRRQSVRYLELARRSLPRTATGDYNRLSRINDHVERAATLWPENPELSDVRDSVLRLTADTAIANKDLVLARVVSERMSRSDEQKKLVRRIEDEEDIICGNEERVYEMHKLVERQRDRAEDLLNFLLVDLHANLKSLGRLDLLEQLAMKSVEYYADYEAVEETPESMRRHGLALRLAGDVLRDQGQLDDALDTYRDLLRLAKALRRRAPESKGGSELFAEANARIGQLLYEQRDLVGALAAYMEALPVRAKLAESAPGDFSAANELAWAHEGIGVVHRRAGRLEEAFEAHDRAIKMREQLVARDPDEVRWIADLTWSLNSQAVVLAQLGRTDEAMDCYHRAVPMRRRLCELDSANATYQRNLAWTIGSVGKLCLETGRPDQARDEYSEAIEILRAQARQDPTNDRLGRDLAWSLGSLGYALEALGRLEESERVLAECGEIQQRIAAKDASHQSLRHEFAWSVILRGTVLGELGRIDAARRCVETGLAIRREWAERDPSASRNRRDLARCHIILSWLARAEGDDTGRQHHLRQAEASFVEVSASDSGAALVEARSLQAMLISLAGDHERAMKLAKSVSTDPCVIEAPFRAFFGRPESWPPPQSVS